MTLAKVGNLKVRGLTEPPRRPYYCLKALPELAEPRAWVSHKLPKPQQRRSPQGNLELPHHFLGGAASSSSFGPLG